MYVYKKGIRRARKRSGPLLPMWWSRKRLVISHAPNELLTNPLTAE